MAAFDSKETLERLVGLLQVCEEQASATNAPPALRSTLAARRFSLEQALAEARREVVPIRPSLAVDSSQAIMRALGAAYDWTTFIDCRSTTAKEEAGHEGALWLAQVG